MSRAIASSLLVASAMVYSADRLFCRSNRISSLSFAKKNDDSPEEKLVFLRFVLRKLSFRTNVSFTGSRFLWS